jgi:uncharacterized protein (DUF1501 family)
VLAHRGSLDRRLVEGRRTDRDAAIALRARQLTSERSRETVAHTLARTVDARGMAMLRELLGNGASPIYAPSLNGAPSDGQLAHCLQQAADALETARQGRRGVLSHD